MTQDSANLHAITVDVIWPFNPDIKVATLHAMCCNVVESCLTDSDSNHQGKNGSIWQLVPEAFVGQDAALLAQSLVLQCTEQMEDFDLQAEGTEM